jgi:osmotically-inducible protein OsmY
MSNRYDDEDRYDERNEELSARRDDYNYERNRFERGSYGARRYDAERDYDRPEYGRDYNRSANMRDPGYERQERYAGYERDYGRDYERDDDRKFGYGRDTARDYGRGTRNPREYERDYERDERDYYNARQPSNYDRGPYGYNYNERRDDWTLRRGARESERPARDARGGRERGWWDRVTDEVASWFGDEGAERRRLRDESQRRANHRGRGPRNYRRSDERISEDINDRLTDHPYLDASDIEVIVDGGEVTLNGSVESRQAKRLAEDIAESVAGVTNVENRLRVTHDASEAINKTTTSAMTTTTDATTEPTQTDKSTSAAAGASGTGRSKTT